MISSWTGARSNNSRCTVALTCIFEILSTTTPKASPSGQLPLVFPTQTRALSLTGLIDQKTGIAWTLSLSLLSKILTLPACQLVRRRVFNCGMTRRKLFAVTSMNSVSSSSSTVATMWLSSAVAVSSFVRCSWKCPMDFAPLCQLWLSLGYAMSYGGTTC